MSHIPNHWEQPGTGRLGRASPGRSFLFEAAATVTPGMLVTWTSTSDGRVEEASAGDPVVGVCRSEADSGESCLVQVEGEVDLPAKSSASWSAGKYWVTAAASSEVTNASAGDPPFAFLIHHDTTNDVARVYLTGDGTAGAANRIMGSDFQTRGIATMSASGPLVVDSSGYVSTQTRQGVTASRPGSAFTGQKYLDTTIGEEMVYDGTRWRSASSKHTFIGRHVTTTITSIQCYLLNTSVTSDNQLPFTCPGDIRILGSSLAMRGGTGSKGWVMQIRLNGSASATWTSTSRVSSTSWQHFTEAVDTDFSAGDRLNFVFVSGTGEAMQVTFSFDWVYR